MASKENKKPANEKNDSEMIRRFKQNPFVFIGTLVVLVIVIVAFVLVPAIVPEYGRGGNMDLTFGYYDKAPISYVPGNYFDRVYRWYVNSNRNTTDGENFFLYYQMWRGAFEEAAVHTAMLQEMKAAGYTVPERIVNRNVAMQFQENGVFSTARYRQVDNNQRLSLWRQAQEEITTNNFRSDIGSLLTPQAEAVFIGNMAATERSFEMVTFSVDAYPDEEYEAYIEMSPELFSTVHLSIITVSSNEREAERILTSIKDGETTFEDAAREHSRDIYADRGGDMGRKMVHELSSDIPDEAVRQNAIALDRGEFSNVMKTPDGWAFFRAEEAVQEVDTSDPAIMEKVRSYVRNFHGGRMEDWAIDQANSFIAMVIEFGFAEALGMQGIESRPFGPIPLNYGNIDLFTSLTSQSISELSDSARNENFWRAAFLTPIDSPSKPVVQGSNVIVLFPTAETTVDEENIERITSMYNSWWLGSVTDQSLRQYFLNSPKMENNFDEVYFRTFRN